MELLKREVESSTGIPLKTMPRWLINEERLKEQQEVNHKRGLAIVITVSSESEAKRLAASGLRFGGARKKLKSTGMLAPDQYVSDAVELGTSAKIAVEIDQKNAQCVQEHIKLVNTNVE